MERLEQMAASLEALGNPTRLAIFRLLVRAGEAGRPVGAIQKAVSIPASTLTHHLKHLELQGLVDRRKEGTTHHCTANYARMRDVIAFLAEECCAEGQTPPIDSLLSSPDVARLRS
ncbi:MAG: helix-turn-helix transcriptional regulator [Rhodospirillales bacterium]|nr:helix-turn-helix transcriptional regulator [Rhodospirillales bacterium]